MAGPTAVAGLARGPPGVRESRGAAAGVGSSADFGPPARGILVSPAGGSWNAALRKELWTSHTRGQLGVRFAESPNGSSAPCSATEPELPRGAPGAPLYLRPLPRGVATAALAALFVPSSSGHGRSGGFC